MANNQKEKNLYTGDPRAEKKFHIGMYYKVAGGYTLVVAILYAVERVLNSRGYLLINTKIPYWLSYALVIGILLVVGRAIANLPKEKIPRTVTKITMSVISVIILYFMFQVIDVRIRQDFRVQDVIPSLDGSIEILVMRADTVIAVPEQSQSIVQKVDESEPSREIEEPQNTENPQETDAPQNPDEDRKNHASREEQDAQEGETSSTTHEYVCTLYKVYPKLNAVFCDGRNSPDQIWLINDPDAEVKYEYTDTGIRFYTEGNVAGLIDSKGVTHWQNEIDLTF